MGCQCDLDQEGDDSKICTNLFLVFDTELAGKSYEEDRLEG